MQVRPPALRSIALATPYGNVVESEQVPPAQFPAALRRFHNRAMSCANSVILLDGVLWTRNSFLEFVREFNATEERSAQHRG